MHRMHRVVPALMLIPAFMLVSLHDRSIAERPDTEIVVNAINALALDLYPKLKQGDTNLFFSPYSISSALAMTYAGARGTTATQMAKTLHFSGDHQNVAEGFGVLNQSLLDSADRAKCTLDVSNALWGQKGYPFLQEFKELIWNAYRGRFTELDFEKAPGAARNTINKAIEEQTRGKIIDLIPAQSINRDTTLVLTNAIYFKGDWVNVFNHSDTRAGDFRLLDGSTIQVPMMHHTGYYGYAEVDGVQILESFYKGHEFSMIVFLPKEHAELEQFERSLTSERLHSLMGQLPSMQVAVSLPKFTVETPSYMLRGLLANMGMRGAFRNKADFSGISGLRNPVLQDVVHKAFVNVDEKGSEAAAATAVIAFESAPALPTQVFRADHPFLFVIRHNPTKCILFMGRLTKP